MEELELGVGALVGFHVEGVNLSFIFPSFLDKNKGDLEDGDNENKKKKTKHIYGNGGSGEVEDDVLFSSRHGMGMAFTYWCVER